MLKIGVLALLALASQVSSFSISWAGSDGTLFQREERNLVTVVVDEDVVGPGERVDVIKIANATGDITVRPFNGGFGGRPQQQLFSPEVKQDGDEAVLSIEIPEEVFIWPGGPDPRFFLEVEDEFEFPETLAIVLHNAVGSPILPPSFPPWPPVGPGGPGGPVVPGGPGGA